MSKVQLQGNVSGTGVFTIASPNSNTDRTLTLPDNTGTILTTGSTGVVTQSMLASSVAGNGPAFFAYSNTATTISQNTFTTVIMDVEVYDTNNCFNTSTYRFTPNVAGYYQINMNVSYSQNTGGATSNFVCSVGRNGSEYQRGSGSGIETTSGNYYANASSLVYCNGTTDYITALCYSSAIGNQLQVGQASVAISGSLVRAA
jgi:hypothetical protein